MRNEHERPVVALQELLQPLDGGEVEVVRRLVQEEQVGLRGEDAGELDAHAPAPGEREERLVEGIRRKAQPAERDLDARFHVVAAQMLEPLLKLAVAAHLLGVGEVVRERRHFALDLAQTRDAAQGVVEKRLVGRLGLGVLAREADARIPLDDAFARVRRFLAEDDLEERRLPRPVRADDAHAVATVDAEGDVGEDVLMAVVNGNPLEVNHGRVSCAASSATRLSCADTPNRRGRSGSSLPSRRSPTARACSTWACPCREPSCRSAT